MALSQLFLKVFWSKPSYSLAQPYLGDFRPASGWCTWSFGDGPQCLSLKKSTRSATNTTKNQQLSGAQRSVLPKLMFSHIYLYVDTYNLICCASCLRVVSIFEIRKPCQTCGFWEKWQTVGASGELLFLPVLLVANLKNGNCAKRAGFERDAKLSVLAMKYYFWLCFSCSQPNEKCLNEYYKKTVDKCKNLVLPRLLLNSSYINLFLLKNYLKTTWAIYNFI